MLAWRRGEFFFGRVLSQGGNKVNGVVWRVGSGLCHFGIVLSAVGGAPSITSALNATPAVIPGVTACDVRPRTVNNIVGLLGRPARDTSPHLLQPLPPGEPANPDVTAAIAVLVRQLEACINAGDQLRCYALFGDDAFRRMPRAEEILAEFAALETSTPLATSAEQRQVLVGPWYVQQLRDGRIMAAVQFRGADDGSDQNSTKALCFVQHEGHWLIDEMTGFIWVAGSDGPVEVEDVVGPPPSS